jgi:hypothetical protein
MKHASNVTHLHNIAARQQAESGREAKPELLEQLREALRSRHYSRRTDQIYSIAIESNGLVTSIWTIFSEQQNKPQVSILI